MAPETILKVGQPDGPFGLPATFKIMKRKGEMRMALPPIFIKHLLYASTTLGAGESIGNKTKMALALIECTIWWRGQKSAFKKMG